MRAIHDASKLPLLLSLLLHVLSVHFPSLTLHRACDLKHVNLFPGRSMPAPPSPPRFTVYYTGSLVVDLISVSPSLLLRLTCCWPQCCPPPSMSMNRDEVSAFSIFISLREIFFCPPGMPQALIREQDYYIRVLDFKFGFRRNLIYKCCNADFAGGHQPYLRNFAQR